MFVSAKMQEDETIRGYFGRISEIVVGIKSCAGVVTKDDTVWKIMKSLPLAYKNKIETIEEIIPISPNFTKETLLGKLQAFEQRLKLEQGQIRIETTFNVQKDRAKLTRRVSTSGDYARKWTIKQLEDKKIDEGLALLAKREPKGRRYFVGWTCK